LTVLWPADRCLDMHELMIRRGTEHLATLRPGAFEEAGDERSTTVAACSKVVDRQVEGMKKAAYPFA